MSVLLSAWFLPDPGRQRETHQETEVAVPLNLLLVQPKHPPPMGSGYQGSASSEASPQPSGCPKSTDASAYPDSSTYPNINVPKCQMTKTHSVSVFLRHTNFNKPKVSPLCVHMVLRSIQGSWPMVQAPQTHRQFILLIDTATVWKTYWTLLALPI